MTISILFILDSKGRVIISRDYRGDIKHSCVDRFVTRLLEEDEDGAKPIFEEDGISYIYVKHNNLYLLAVTRKNVDAALAVLFLYTLISVLEEYFQRLEEESIRDNFVITYELLDEMMDFGYPQSTESQILKQYITQQGHKLNKAEVSVPENLTGKIFWRPPGIKYRKNEVFLDVIEKVNLLVGSNGAVLNSEIIGQVQVKCYLSGMPELRLGLNDRVQLSERGKGGEGNNKSLELEDVKFHKCVDLSKFDSEGLISFIPPDGDFELLSYRLTTKIKPLFWIEAIVDAHAHSRVEYMIKARSQFKPRSVANNVQIIIPVPPDADSPKFRASLGTVKYVPEKNAVIWTIRQFAGDREYLMRAHFGLPSVQNEEDISTSAPPIEVVFEIPYFTVSGIQVRYLKILEPIERYTALPWVRYITQNGQYQIRTT